MRKLSFIVVMVLLVVASCTKKSAPTSSNSMDGSPLYAQNCAKCHGATGIEGRAPNLAKGDLNKNEITDKIAQGGGRMPAFSDKLSAKEIDAVAQFVIHLRK